MFQLSNRHFNFRRFRYFVVLTFVASLLVSGGIGYLSGTPLTPSIVWQSLALAVLVGGVAGWKVRPGKNDPAVDQKAISPANDDSGADHSASPAARSSGMDSLEEQGITIKLLELTALGDRYGNVFSVAMIGLDNLEDIVEQYDEEITADLLKKVSGALARTLRMPDRVGDYEYGSYLVVLPETRLPGAIQIAERLRDAVSGLDVAVSDRLHVHTTASVGVTSFRRGDDLQSLVRRAEKALREAQHQGRNRVLPDMAA